MLALACRGRQTCRHACIHACKHAHVRDVRDVCDVRSYDTCGTIRLWCCGVDVAASWRLYVSYRFAALHADRCFMFRSSVARLIFLCLDSYGLLLVHVFTCLSGRIKPRGGATCSTFGPLGLFDQASQLRDGRGDRRSGKTGGHRERDRHYVVFTLGWLACLDATWFHVTGRTPTLLARRSCQDGAGGEQHWCRLDLSASWYGIVLHGLVEYTRLNYTYRVIAHYIIPHHSM